MNILQKYFLIIIVVKNFFDNLPDETESTDKEFIDGQQIVDHPMYTQKPIATETILDQRLTNIMIIDK
jgi:hypothetical protein